MAQPPMIIDQWGRPVSTAKLKTEQAGPSLRGVRRHDAMHPAAGLEPGRLAAILRSSIDSDPELYLALAEDMEERDLHYAGVLGTRKGQVASLEITVEAAGDDAVSAQAAALVREVVEREGFEDELIDVLDAIGKGFSCTEIIWDTSEGQWRPKRLAWRDPRWFTFDRLDGETPLLRDPEGHVPLNPYQWVFHQAKAKSGLPIRGGLARAVAWGFMFKAYTVKDWAIFCEAYGQPLRLGKYDGSATDDDKDKLLEAVSNIGTDFAAIVPQSMSVEFIKAEISGSHQLYKERADWLDQQVSKLVLGQTATTDAIAGGHAVGKTHDGVREDIERKDARQLAGTLNRDLVRPVVDFELGPQKKYPRIRIGRPDDVDPDKLMATVDKFVRIGGKVSMSKIRDRIGLPEPAAGDELLGAPPAPSVGAPGGGAPGDQPVPGQSSGQVETAAFSAKVEKPQDAIDRSVAALASDWEPLVGPIVEGLAAEIGAAASLAEVRQLLEKRFASLDPSALTEQLARAVFAARLAGEVDDRLS